MGEGRLARSSNALMGGAYLRSPTPFFWTNGGLGFLRECQQPLSVQINATPRVGKYDRPGKPETIEQAHAQFTL